MPEQTKARNPKDILAASEQRVLLHLIPSTGLVKVALAMMDGAKKYGPYNWRDEDVGAGTYTSAAERHIRAWLDGEEEARDSKVHHLAHAAACCLILMDAQATDNLVDDRPPVAPTADMMEAVKRGSAVEEPAWEPCMECGNRVSCTCDTSGFGAPTRMRDLQVGDVFNTLESGYLKVTWVGEDTLEAQGYYVPSLLRAFHRDGTVADIVTDLL